MSVIKQIQDVLALEEKTLQDVRLQVNSSFEKAVNLLYNTTNIVCFFGVGKSYHIAAKIASTLASTGTRAVCLHPSEAQHGDLGVVREKDTVVLLSKSGETEEMLQLLPALRLLQCSIISIVSSKESKIAKLADIVLYVPVKEEACALKLAPTCSTTAMLAVGDALAVVLMRKKNFTKEEFALRHPAGSLGKQLLYTVKDVMSKDEMNPTVLLSASFETVLDLIMQYKMNALSVVNEANEFQGMITSYDIRKTLKQYLHTKTNLEEQTAATIMNKQATTIDVTMLALRCFEAMKRKQLPKIVPVLQEGKTVGMLSIDQLLLVGF